MNLYGTNPTVANDFSGQLSAVMVDILELYLGGDQAGAEALAVTNGVALDGVGLEIGVASSTNIDVDIITPIVEAEGGVVDSFNSGLDTGVIRLPLSGFVPILLGYSNLSFSE